LGKFELSGIPATQRGDPEIEVVFDVDADGILNVSATEINSGVETTVTISNEKGRLSKGDMERMIKEAEKYKEDDLEHRQRIISKNNLEYYCFNMKCMVMEDGIKKRLGEENLETILEACDSAIL